MEKRYRFFFFPYDKFFSSVIRIYTFNFNSLFIRRKIYTIITIFFCYFQDNVTMNVYEKDGTSINDLFSGKKYFLLVYFGDMMVCIYVKPKYESHACNLGQVTNNITLALFQLVNRKTLL